MDTTRTEPTTPNWLGDQLIIGRENLELLTSRLYAEGHRPVAALMKESLEMAKYDRIWVPIAPTFLPPVVSALNGMGVKVGGIYSEAFTPAREEDATAMRRQLQEALADTVAALERHYENDWSGADGHPDAVALREVIERAKVAYGATV